VTCQTTPSIGAYVVGALEPEERGRVEEHLRGCAQCSTALGVLEGLPAVLSKLTLADLEDVAVEAAASEQLYERVAARLREEAAAVVPLRRRTEQVWGRHRKALLAAAAAVVLAAGVGVSAATLSSSSPGSQVRVGTQGPVTMRVSLASQTTGTALRVTVSGLHGDEHCRLIAIADDGTRDVVGQWDATYDGEAQETGSTSIAAAHLTRLVLLGNNGRELVTVPL
jgi:anti-sigma-K factor RskA